MFYVWLFTSFCFLISILSQLYCLSLGIFPEISNFALTVALQITTLSLAIRKIQEPHRVSYSFMAIGLWIMVTGSFLLLMCGDFVNMAGTVRIIESSLFLIALGSFLFYYNKKGLPQSQMRQIPQPNYEDEEDETFNEKIYEVVFQIERALQLHRVAEGTAVAKTLQNCEAYITGVERKNYNVSKSLLSQVAEILESYIDLTVNSLPTQRCLETLERIEDCFADIETAFAQIYDNAISGEIDEANIRVEVLGQQLRMKGLLGSDFDEIA